jgi:hypothetical protein
MRLTKRGELVVVAITLLLSATFIIGSFIIGQERKQDRIQQQWEQTE